MRHDTCNIVPGLSNTFLNNRRKNNIKADLEFTLKVMERARNRCAVTRENVTLINDTFTVRNWCDACDRTFPG